MLDSSQKPWSNGPNTPQIPYSPRFSEKINFAGVLLGAVFYGSVAVLFFQCMGAFLSPLNPKRRFVKWGLLAHTAIMFAAVTIYTAISLYIENRDSPGTDELPLGYQHFTCFRVICVVTTIMFVLNNWLADAIMLYRCCLIYPMQRWLITFPCLVYLGSLSTGITFIYKSSQPFGITYVVSAVRELGIPHQSISVLLNILFTLMIIARLMLHGRGIRDTLGPSASICGWNKDIVTVLTESFALFTVTFLLFVAPWAANNSVVGKSFPILIEIQVIAPFLVILRVVNQSFASSIDDNTPTATTEDGVEVVKTTHFHHDKV